MPFFFVNEWTKIQLIKFFGGVALLALVCITPLYWLEKMAWRSLNQQHRRLPLDSLLQKSHQFRNDRKLGERFLRVERPVTRIRTVPNGMSWTPKNVTLDDLELLSDEALLKNLPLARGVAGRPMEQTPALNGGRRGHIECDVNVDSLAYWNDPQGDRDVKFTSPFSAQVSAVDVLHSRHVTNSILYLTVHFVIVPCIVGRNKVHHIRPG